MYYIYWFLLKIVSLLPFWLLYILSDFTYLLIYYVFRYRKKVVRDNLNRSFLDKTDKERLKIERKFYRNFCDLFLESAKPMSMNANEIQRRMVFLDYEQLFRHYDEGRSVILMTAHYANWEWTSSFNLLLPEDKHAYQVYMKLKSEAADKIIYNIRKKFGSENVEVAELFDVITEMKHNGKLGMFGMISDQSPAAQSIRHHVWFLNQRTPVITGTEMIARKYDFPVYYAQIRKVKRGYYTCKFLPICIEPTKTKNYEITEEYIRILENEIMREPAYWLWSHRRWKFAKK